MFSNGAYAKVWEIKRIEEKYADIRISTSKKIDEGKYEQDFGGFVRLVGKARGSADFIHEGDKIILKSCGVTNKYDADKKVTYTNFTVFDIETVENENVAAEENPFID